MADEEIQAQPTTKMVLEVAMWVAIMSAAIALGWMLAEQYRKRRAMLAPEEDVAPPASPPPPAPPEPAEPSDNGAVAQPQPYSVNDRVEE